MISGGQAKYISGPFRDVFPLFILLPADELASAERFTSFAYVVHPQGIATEDADEVMDSFYFPDN